MARRFKPLAVLAAQAADEKKGEDIALKHLRKSTLAEYVLLVTVNSSAQMEAVEEHIQETLEAEGAWAVHHDGRRGAQWRVLDYGGLLVHLAQPEVRSFYSLDRLHAEASAVDWKEDRAPARVRHVR